MQVCMYPALKDLFALLYHCYCDVFASHNNLEKKLAGYDEDITFIFQYQEQLLNAPSPPR